jgi:8-oxo-dGTP pyrophosphatase MutT (NUDIX family)
MIKDAATILLLRGEADFEIFMVERGKTAQFMARAMVFPGGRVDEADHDLASACDLTPQQAARALGMDDADRALAYYVAAIRETFEEAGVLLADGVDGPLAELREALNAETIDFAAVVAQTGATLRASALVPFAHWVTPPIEKRRYDTVFFLARVPDAQQASHDAIENTAGAWLKPKAALATHADGKMRLAPPTLWELTELSGCADATAACALRPALPAAIQPQPFDANGEFCLLLPDDAQFDPPGTGVSRVALRSGRWWIVRD